MKKSTELWGVINSVCLHSSSSAKSCHITVSRTLDSKLCS